MRRLWILVAPAVLCLACLGTLCPCVRADAPPADSPVLRPLPPTTGDSTPDKAPQNPPEPPPSVVSDSRQPQSAGVVAFSAYNTRARDLDLWNIEARKWMRSDVVISPDRARMAYTEISFMPDARQTIAALYGVTMAPEAEPAMASGDVPAATAVSVSAPSAPTSRWRFWRRGGGSSSRAQTAPTAAEIQQASRYEPDLQLQGRERWHQVGFSRTRPYRFETLTIVDWSASGRRLLFKRRSGILYYGLRTTDILLYDGDRRVVSLYGDLQRAIRAYWQSQRAPDELRAWNDWDWDLAPLGFRPGSDSLVVATATAFDAQTRQFWGVWELDLDQRRVRLLSRDNAPPPVAANGLLAKSSLRYDPQTGQWSALHGR